MKLIFAEDFKLEVRDDTYNGTLRDLTKKERKEADKKQKPWNDKVKESEQLNKKIISLTMKKEVKSLEIGEQ